MTTSGSEFENQEADIRGEGYLPGLAIDTVIFGFHDDQLKVLLLSYKNSGFYALPGGFIHNYEDVNEAAERILYERTGLHNIFLNQFYVFGDKSRHDIAPLKKIISAKGTVLSDEHWLLKRFVSIGYYALVDYKKAIPTPDSISDSCDWHSIKELPVLMQDHRDIIEKGLATLRDNLDQKLIGFNLLSEEFTMNELQRIYETVLDKEIIRASFQRKILSLGILELTAKKVTGNAHKAPYLYKFINNEK